MSTFSINIGTSTESVRYPLISYSDVDYLLNKLIDNDTKLINPWDLRDTILSLYSASGFKLTDSVVTNKQYVGIDTLDPSSKDLKKVIYLGKRSFSGTYSYVNTHDILSTFTFSNGENDLYFFNTKKDTVSNEDTKISFLAGTPSGLHNVSPYLRTQTVNGTTSLSFDVINQSILGNINIESVSATVSVNDIVFPSIATSIASASNNQTLMWQDGKLEWADITYGDIDFIGATGVDLQIFGTPVNINDFPLVLNDKRKLPLTINDMIIGMTFSQQPIVEILKKLIYPYLPPLCSISILAPYSDGYTEVGTYPTPVVQFTIIKRSYSTFPATLGNMIPGIYPSITNPGQTTQTSTANGVVITPISTSPTIFTVNVSDGTQSTSATASLQGIYPYFYGYSTLNTMSTIGLASLTKLVQNKSDKNLSVIGSGNLYFVYDVDYGPLQNIYDWNGSTASGSFSVTTQVLSSPTGLWAAKQFYVYKYSGAPTLGPPGFYFQFKY